MKTFLTTLILASACLAREVTIGWDAAPAAQQVTSWRVWRGTNLLATTGTPVATVHITHERAALTITAVNSAGESPASSELIIAPTLVWIQKSTDLRTWENVVQVPYQSPSQFVRIEIPPP